LPPTPTPRQSFSAFQTFTATRWFSPTPAISGWPPIGVASHAPHAPSGIEVSQFSPAGSDWLHRTVRGRRTGLCHPRDRERPEAIDVFIPAAALYSSLGYDKSRSTVEPPRQIHRFPVLRDTSESTRRNRPLQCSLTGAPHSSCPIRRPAISRANALKLSNSPALPRFSPWDAIFRWLGPDKLSQSENPRRGIKITDDPRAHRDPMWIGGKIFYSSDKDDTLNLYAYDVKTRKTDQLTHSTKWDVRWPSSDHKSQIVMNLVES